MHHYTLATILIMTGFLVACSSGNTRKSTDYGYIDATAPVFKPAKPNEQAIPITPVKPITQQTKQQRIAIRRNTPDSYTVKPGDTVWDIANLFLINAWLWPEVWYVDPQIQHPDLIYPGDIITLVYIDGKPQLRLTRNRNGLDNVSTTPGPVSPQGLKSYKLSPRVRVEDIKNAIPIVPVSTIRPFLNKPQVISKEELENAPYIVGKLDKHLASGMGNTVYVRGLENNDIARYDVFRPGRKFIDPITKELLGYEATLVSEAKLNKMGDPATLVLTSSNRETLRGDRILPAELGKINYNFTPSAPEYEMEGKIIALVGALSHTGKNEIVVINLGQRDGVNIGNIFAIDQSGVAVRDHWSKHAKGETIQLPGPRAGLLMVFRSFDRVSYAIVMESKRVLYQNDIVRNPTPLTNAYE